MLEQIVRARYGGYGWLEFGAVDDAVDAPAAESDGDTRGGDAPTDFTTTNVQEEGVDEVDLVKTNGTHMFVAEDRGFHVLDAWPAEDAHKLATLDLDGWAQGLFLVGDKAVVFVGSDTDTLGLTTDRWDSAVRMLVIDVSDPAHPSIERTVDIQGWMTDARMVDGTIYAVLNQSMQMPEALWNLVWTDDPNLPAEPYDKDWDDPAWEQARAKARTYLAPKVAKIVDQLDLADVLPSWRTEAGKDVTEMYACDDLYAPSEDSPLQMLSIVSLDPATGRLDSTGLEASGWTIYASQDNLYVAQSSRWWWGWAGSDEGVTQIHRFALHADSEPVYTGAGEVGGWIYDQFAMSEYEGDLRVVTTDFATWWGEGRQEAANNVSVLRDNGEGSLDVIGKVGGIAPGEQIQAVRMIKDKGYVVTFEQVDPLFTIDLSDPTKPEVVGELEIPGFSGYLHPIDDDHLLAVGRSGTEQGQITGLAVNIFDVSDFAKPTLQHTYTINHGNGWSWSEALWDHHAFTYHRDILTIPATYELYDEQSGTYDGFSGTVSVRATPDGGIQEIGQVDHHDLVAKSRCLWDDWYLGDERGKEGTDVEPGWSYCSWDYGYWYAQVRRSVYIEDNLFTISDYGVKVNDLEHPDTELGEVVFYPR
ncbi:MAG: beta-propeller domain-containing protein [Alphaproteobacteria bacterium]|nr:beta-propeller domain-containing protein [Alphaproteobacteria bacterium]